MADAASPETMEAFHGTLIQYDPANPDEMDFHLDNLRIGMSDLSALWVASSEDTAEWFSEYHSSDPDEEIFAVAKCSVCIRNPFVFEPGSPLDIEIEDDHGSLFEFNVVNDREELYACLVNLGYDAMIIRDNYGSEKDDIALLSDDCLLSVDEVKLRKHQEPWGPYLNPQDAYESLVPQEDAAEA